jgi:hypothetical protein
MELRHNRTTKAVNFTFLKICQRIKKMHAKVNLGCLLCDVCYLCVMSCCCHGVETHFQLKINNNNKNNKVAWALKLIKRKPEFKCEND